MPASAAEGMLIGCLLTAKTSVALCFVEPGGGGGNTEQEGAPEQKNLS